MEGTIHSHFSSYYDDWSVRPLIHTRQRYSCGSTGYILAIVAEVSKLQTLRRRTDTILSRITRNDMPQVCLKLTKRERAAYFILIRISVPHRRRHVSVPTRVKRCDCTSSYLIPPADTLVDPVFSPSCPIITPGYIRRRQRWLFSLQSPIAGEIPGISSTTSTF